MAFVIVMQKKESFRSCPDFAFRENSGMDFARQRFLVSLQDRHPGH
jgi:hypothetical protein